MQLGTLQSDVYLPDSKPLLPGGRAPMVALHGCAQGSEATGVQGNWELPADAFGMMVVSPSLPDKGVVRGCWYFHRDDNRRDNKHNVHIIGMVRSVLADPLFGIDPAQVYVTGISSGGGQAYALGCLAPDLFAGVAPVAAPTLPVGMSLFSIVRASTDEATGLAHCRQLKAWPVRAQEPAGDSLASTPLLSSLSR